LEIAAELAALYAFDAARDQIVAAHWFWTESVAFQREERSYHRLVEALLLIEYMNLMVAYCKAFNWGLFCDSVVGACLQDGRFWIATENTSSPWDITTFYPRRDEAGRLVKIAPSPLMTIPSFLRHFCPHLTGTDVTEMYKNQEAGKGPFYHLSDKRKTAVKPINLMAAIGSITHANSH